MRLTNEIVAIVTHVGNPPIGEIVVKGTVESVLRQVLKSVVDNTLFTRIDISIGRTEDDCRSKRIKKIQANGEFLDDAFADLMAEPQHDESESQA